MIKILFLLSLSFFFAVLAQASDFGTVATPAPQATAAGERVLQAGGTAADAVIAAALTLGVVAPEMSGLGGGGVLLYYDKSQNQFSYFDFLESMPADSLFSPKGTSAISLAGVPGVPAGFEKIHQRFGKLPWNVLFDEAIQFADEGFLPPPMWRARLQQVAESNFGDEDFRSFFGDVWISDHALLKQETLAATLKSLRDEGANSFYRGALSEKILRELNEKKTPLTLADWNFYEVQIGAPLSFYFKDLKVMVPNLPSYGGQFLDQLLRAARVAKIASNDPDFPHFIEKSVRKFLSTSPVLQKMPSIKSGYGAQLSVVDAQGNRASLQTTLHGFFGNGTFLKQTGILMNATGHHPRLTEALAEDDRVNLGGRQKRGVDFILPVMVMRGFDESFVFGTSGGVTAPQNLFQIIYKMQSEKASLSEAVRAAKFYTLPNEKQNLYEKKYPARLLKAKLDFPAQLSPYEIGRVIGVEVNKATTRAVIDERRDRPVKVAQRKIRTTRHKVKKKEVQKTTPSDSDAKELAPQGIPPSMPHLR